MSGDSQVYDASEEDNTDDASSAVGVPVGGNASGNAHGTRHMPASPLAQGRSAYVLGSKGGSGSIVGTLGGTAAHRPGAPGGRDTRTDLESDSGVDSPTYDGDIESSTTAAPTNHHPSSASRYLASPPLNSPPLTASTSSLNAGYPPSISESSTSTNEPISAVAHLPHTTLTRATPRAVENTLPFFDVNSNPMPHITPSSPRRPPPKPPADGEESHTGTATARDIQEFVQAAINGTDGTPRAFKINPPPQGRPVRIYADGEP